MKYLFTLFIVIENYILTEKSAVEMETEATCRTISQQFPAFNALVTSACLLSIL